MQEVAKHYLDKKISSFYTDYIQPRKNKRHLVLGEQPGPSDIILSSNDYLCLSNHPEIVEAQMAVLTGKKRELLMSAIFLDSHSPQQRLQNKLADFLRFEAAIICQSGWAANVGLLQTIAGKDMPVYIDHFAHASLWDGIIFAKAHPVMFRHNHMESLKKKIQKYGSGIILVDSVYSTIGTVAQLRRIAELAQEYECILVVDESHSLGTHGYQGRGLVHEWGLSDKVDFITASLAKTFAGRAGLIACSEKFARYFPYSSHPAIFSSALLHSEIAALDATLNVIKKAHTRRKKLFNNAQYLRDELIRNGHSIASQSQIIALETGSEEKTEEVRDILESRGVFGAVFCRPATGKNHAIIRMTLHSDLTEMHLNKIVTTIPSLCI